MRKWLLFLIPAVLLVGGMVAVLSTREREPEYGGKRLSEWVMSDFSYLGPEDQNPMRQALHGMGTNTVPYLLEWVGYEAPAWKRNLYGAINPILGRLHPSLEFIDKKEIRADRVAFVIGWLANERERSQLLRVRTNQHARKFILSFVAQLDTHDPSAVARFQRLLSDSDPKIRTSATNALRMLDPEALERRNQ